MSEPSPHETALIKVMMFGTALAFGGLGAVMLSMKDFFHGDAAFQFSFRTILGFAIGFVVGWLIWRFLRQKITNT